MSHVIFVKKSGNNHVQLFYICMSNYSTSVFLDCQAFIVKYFIIVRILRQTSQKGWESVGEGILGSKKLTTLQKNQTWLTGWLNSWFERIGVAWSDLDGLKK